VHAALVASAVLGAIAFVVSCSLGLDESLIGQVDAGTGDDSPANDVNQPKDTGSDGPPPITPEAGVCTTDTDCKATTDGCLKAHCDTPRKACVFDVCKPAACQTSTCDTSTSTHTCGASPKTHKFLAAQFPVQSGIGCGGNARACFAAVYPYVFVGTPNGVVAFSAADPGNATPASVAVTGLGFVPGSIVTSGSRVFFLGGATGAGASSRVQLAWIDVPPDPFRTSVAAQTVLATYNRPVTEPGFALGLLTRANDTALLVDFNPAQSFPATPVEPPLNEPLALGSAAIPFTAGTNPQATSGTRLLMGAFNTAAGTGSFGLIANAGGTATNGGDVPFGAGVAPVYPTESFAIDPQGGVVWVVESLNQPPGPPPPPPPGSLVRAVKGYFLLADGAANFDFTQGVDLEVYNIVPPGPPPAQGAGAALVGPTALIDTKTALVTTADKNNPAQTNVQILAKQPLGLVAGKKTLLPANAVGTLGAAGSNG
jgi:hypothetical protein